MKESKLQQLGGPKTFWKTVKSIMNKDTSSNNVPGMGVGVEAQVNHFGWLLNGQHNIFLQ